MIDNILISLSVVFLVRNMNSNEINDLTFKSDRLLARQMNRLLAGLTASLPSYEARDETDPQFHTAASMRNAYVTFIEAFRDAWTILGMVATTVGFILVIYHIRHFPVSVVFSRIFGFYEAATRIIFYPVGVILGFTFPQSIKDVMSLYLLFGATLARSYYVFCSKRDRDQAHGRAERFMYGNRGNVLGTLLQPHLSRGAIRRSIALMICFFFGFLL